MHFILHAMRSGRRDSHSIGRRLSGEVMSKERGDIRALAIEHHSKTRHKVVRLEELGRATLSAVIHMKLHWNRLVDMRET